MEATIGGRGYVVTVDLRSQRVPELRDRKYLWSEIVLVQSDIANATHGIIGSMVIAEPCNRRLRIVAGSPEWQLRNGSRMVQVRLLHVSLLNTGDLFYDSAWLGSHRLPPFGGVPSGVQELVGPREGTNTHWTHKDLPWSLWFGTLPFRNEDLAAEAQMAQRMRRWLLGTPTEGLSLRRRLGLWTKMVGGSLAYATAMNFRTYGEDPGNGAHYYPEQVGGGDCKDYASYMMRSYYVCRKLCETMGDLGGWGEVFGGGRVYYHGARVGSVEEGDHINLIYVHRESRGAYVLDPVMERVYRYDVNNKRTRDYIKKSLYCSSMEDGVQGVTEGWEFRRVSKRLC